MRKIFLPFLSSFVFLTSAFASDDQPTLKTPNAKSEPKIISQITNISQKKGQQCVEISTFMSIPMRISYGYRQLNELHGWDIMFSYSPLALMAYHAVLVESSYLRYWTSKDKNRTTYFGIGGGGGVAQLVFDSGRKRWFPIPSLFLKAGIQTNMTADVSPYYGLKIGFPNSLSLEAGLGF